MSLICLCFLQLVSYLDVLACKNLCTDFSEVTLGSELLPNPLYMCFIHVYSAANFILPLK